MRKLASVQRIKEISMIKGADSIEVASILGWKVVVKKSEFKVGDLVVYCEIDSVLPEGRPEFEFLRNKKFRIKTIKLRNQVSQGIAFPLNILPKNEYKEGEDVTDIIGVTKYEVPIPACLSGEVKGSFPGYVYKTDETRIQAEPNLIEEFKGRKVYISQKIDGTSGTFCNFDDEIDVCSRNLSLIEKEDNTFWKLFHKYEMKKIFESVGNFAIQGEVAGPGIQKNRLCLKDHELFVFNIFNIDKSKYLDFKDMIDFCKKWNLTHVPILESDIEFNYTLDELLKLAQGKYEGTKNDAEGIVIRPIIETYSKTLNSRLSVKVINNKFLLKNGE